MSKQIYMNGCHLVVDVPDGTYYMVIKDEQEKDENEMYSEIVEITSRSEFELDKDGMYNIYLFTIPNVTFEDGKIKIDEYESYDSKKLILSHINNIFTIGGYECIEQEILCICNLKKCLLNLQMKAFKEGTANCGSTKCKNQENKSQRDYIFLGVWLIEQFIERGLLEQAKNVYDCLQSCGSICGNLLKTNNDCGCNG